MSLLFVILLPSKYLAQLLTVLAAAVILLLTVSAGADEGKALAQSEAVLNNAGSLAKGLHYFYGDQQRYPTAAEYSGDANLMLNYFNAFPPRDLSSGQCPLSFDYQRPTAQTFKLDYCLSASWSGFLAGWNQVNQDSQF